MRLLNTRTIHNIRSGRQQLRLIHRLPCRSSIRIRPVKFVIREGDAAVFAATRHTYAPSLAVILRRYISSLLFQDIPMHGPPVIGLVVLSSTGGAARGP